MTNFFVCYYNGFKFWKVGRMKHRLTPFFVKLNQRKMSLVDKWKFGFVGNTGYTIYDYI